jgi:hypothetical protein
MKQNELKPTARPIVVWVIVQRSQHLSIMKDEEGSRCGLGEGISWNLSAGCQDNRQNSVSN